MMRVHQGAGVAVVLLVLLLPATGLPMSEVPPWNPEVQDEAEGGPRALGAPPAPIPAAPPFGTNIRVSDGPAPPDSEQNEVSMGIDFEGRLLAGWNDYRTGQPHYRCGTSQSLDNGQTWSPSQLVFDPAYTAAADPVVTNDAVGRTYFVCLTYEPDLSDSDIQAWTSLDAGQTWVSQSSLGLPDPGFDDKPWAAAWGDGYLFAIWTFFHAPCDPFGCNGSNVVFRASSDAGVSWGPVVNFTTSRLGHFGQVDVDRYGRVHVTYRDDGRFYYRRSDDLGQAFTAPVFISDAGQACQGCSPARSATIPTLSVDPTGRDLYVVWNAALGAPAPEDIHLATSHDGGNTWTRSQLTSDGVPGTRDLWPAVDVDHDGLVHLMWSRLPIQLPPAPAWGNMSVVYTNSTDGGLTFAPLIQVNDVDFETAGFMGDYQVMLVDDWGFGHLAWCDNRLGTFLASDTEIYSAHTVLATPGPHFLDINPKDVTITAGQTVQYTATVTDPYGNVPADAIEWVVTGGSIDTAGLYTSSAIGTFRVRFYAGFRFAETNVTVLQGPLFRLDVTPPTATIPAGGSQQFAAAGYDAGGNPVPIAPTWATDGGNVDGTGLYTHTVAGTYTVFANDSGVSGNASITVTPGPAVSLVVTPPAATITADQTQQFTATGYDAFGNPTPVSPTWSVTNGSISGTGLFTPRAVGVWVVTATDGFLSGNATVTVVPGALVRIDVTPPTATITADQTQQYTATGYDAKGNVVPINPVWSTDGGSINATGLYDAGPVGIWTVAATDGLISGTATITVTAGALVSIVVSPPSATITADQTQVFTATGYDADGNVVPIAPTWSVNGGSIDSAGVYAPDVVGTYVVTATDGGVSGTASVTVVAGTLVLLVVDPPAATITADQTQQYTATGYDAKGNVVPVAPTWTATTGSVDATGLYSPTLVGTWIITATDGLISGTATVTVTLGTLASIVVTPPSATIAADQTQQYTATGYDARGNVVPITPAWTATMGTIDTTGLYSPTLVGTWIVTATDGVVSGTATVTVTPGALGSIVVTPASATITADDTQQYTATGYDAKGNTVPIAPTWATGGGSVSATGLYTPARTGTYTVFANESGVSGNATVVVTAGVLARLVVTPPTATITADETQQYAAEGFDQHDNPVAVSPAWSVDGGSIDASGLYTPTPAGTFTVAAADGALAGTATVTVVPGALASIVVTPSDPTITADETQQFTAAGLDAKGNAIAVTLVWAANGGTIAPSGLYSGVAAGTFTVTATQGPVAGTTTVTVTAGAPATIEVSPRTAELRVGDNLTFTAMVRDADGNLLAATIVWGVDATGTIGPAGRFVADAAGTGTVTAMVAGTSLSDTAAVTVTDLETPTVMPWWILIVLVVAVLILLFLLWRRRKKREEEPPGPVPESTEPPPVQPDETTPPETEDV